MSQELKGLNGRPKARIVTAPGGPAPGLVPRRQTRRYPAPADSWLPRRPQRNALACACARCLKVRGGPAPPPARGSVDVHWQIETLPRYLPGATRRAEQARADSGRVVPRRELMAGVRGEPHGGGPRRGVPPMVERDGRARAPRHVRSPEQ